MAARNVARPVVLENEERAQLESFAASRSLPHAQVVRAKIVLMGGFGFSINNQALHKMYSHFFEA